MQIMYMRSLGETGDINGLLEAWQQLKLSIEKPAQARAIL